MRHLIVSGALANKPFNGGEAWVRLSWALGLRRLGFRVYFVEQIDPRACVDAAGAPAAVGHSANLAYFRDVTREFGLAETSALIDAEIGQTHGLSPDALRDAAAAAELLVNISGHLTWPAVTSRVGRKAFVDIDPGYTQIWHAEGNLNTRLEGHDLFFTIGENIGRPGCDVPTAGIQWRPTRQPVVLADWPVCDAPDPGRFTTVASWRGAYGPVQLGGRTFGVKAHEFRKFAGVPTRLRGSGQTFELALDIHPGDARDRDLLTEQGWRIVPPADVAAGPAAFRRYVQRSGAEFSAAQGVYVQTGSGWFSDRTVRYLASGKPALVQETGFSRNLPAREGLVPFSTVDDAVDGARRIAADYRGHAEAARAIAESNADPDWVLG
jgi:hypothetical protein